MAAAPRKRGSGDEAPNGKGDAFAAYTASLKCNAESMKFRGAEDAPGNFVFLSRSQAADDTRPFEFIGFGTVEIYMAW